MKIQIFQVPDGSPQGDAGGVARESGHGAQLLRLRGAGERHGHSRQHRPQHLVTQSWVSSVSSPLP